MDHNLLISIPDPGNILVVVFVCFLQKRRAPNNDAEWSDVCTEISHTKPVESQKLKLFKVLIYLLCLVYCTFCRKSFDLIDL